MLRCSPWRLSILQGLDGQCGLVIADALSIVHEILFTVGAATVAVPVVFVEAIEVLNAVIGDDLLKLAQLISHTLFG